MLTEFSQVESAQQTLTFLYAILLGAAFSLLFDLFRCLRAVTRCKPVATFLLDVLYFLLAAVITACFLMVRCSGEVRLFALLGIALGGVIGRLTLSKWFFRALLWIAQLIRRAIQLVFCPVLKWIRRLAKWLGARLEVLFRWCKNILKRNKKPLANMPGHDV